MRIRGLVAIAAITGLVSACGSAQEASVGNFKQVIDAHYARDCILVRLEGGRGVETGRFPVTVELNASQGQAARERNAWETREFDALVAVGLLRVEDTTVASRGWHVGPAKQVPAKRYTLTEAGEKNYRADEQQPPAGFCAGHYQVDEIKRFSEPGARGPYTMSEVAYVYSPQDVPDWATEPRVLQTMPELVTALRVGQDGQAVLIKTNEGWFHERDFDD